MNDFVIAIDREYGSGGLQAGQLLAQKLGIKCYNQELLKMAAAESGLSEEVFENHDEKPVNSFLYSLVMDTYSVNRYNSSQYMDMPLNHKVFLAMFDTIKKLASQESCVIVGRCADYALADMSNMVSVFVHAEQDYKINRTVSAQGISADKAKTLMQKTDKKRANYYNYFSSKRWGEAKSYHLSLDSSKLGTEGCVEMIVEYLNIKHMLMTADLFGDGEKHHGKHEEKVGKAAVKAHDAEYKELNTWYGANGFKARLFVEQNKFFIYYNSHGEDATYELQVHKYHDDNVVATVNRPGLPDKYLKDASHYIKAYLGL